jgi:hypothetical protein
MTEFRTGASGSFLQEIDRRNTMKIPFEATYSSANSKFETIPLLFTLLLITLLRRL